MKHLAPRLATLLSTALLATGCATAFLRSHDELKVVTDPPGATARAGDTSVVTPGVLKIPRRKEPVIVRVEKEGFASREVTVGWSRSGVVWANVVGVSAGVAVGTVTSFWGRIADDDNARSAAVSSVLVGAVITATGLAIDHSSLKKYSLERDDLVLRLEPVRLAEAPKGALR